MSFTKDAERIRLKTFIPELTIDRAFLLAVISVPAFWTAIVRRGFPFPFGPLLWLLTALIIWPFFSTNSAVSLVGLLISGPGQRPRRRSLLRYLPTNGAFPSGCGDLKSWRIIDEVFDCHVNPYLRVKSHNLWKESDGVNETCFKFRVFSLAMVSTSSFLQRLTSGCII